MISFTQIDANTLELLRNRGPNDSHQICFEGETYCMVLAGFVLWQQGEKLCRQPITSSVHSLLMNGDIFTEREVKEQSDTEWLLEQIDLCANEADLIELFRCLEGPYSLVFYNKTTEILYFVRDSLGRQSLLVAIDDDGGIYFSSVLGNCNIMLFTHTFECHCNIDFLPISAKSPSIKSAIEVPSLGLYAIDMKTKSASLHPWKDSYNESFRAELHELQVMLEMDIQLKTSIFPRWMDELPSLMANDFNFENLLRDDTNTEPEKIFQKLLAEATIENYCDVLIATLRKSVRDRISATPPVCRKCLSIVDGPQECSHAKIGILFSGGIDCTILACLADQLVDVHLPIDLINVSFEKIVRVKMSKPVEIDFNTPDRLSALATLKELKRLNPNRQWNLINVNVTRNELNEMLRRRICHLVYPLTSVLDESLGAVLWFGSNANGFSNEKPYKSSCRVSESFGIRSDTRGPKSLFFLLADSINWFRGR